MLQLDRPSSLLYLPALHRSHADWPDDAYFPGGHRLLQLDMPALPYRPAGHAPLHVAFVLPPVPYRPAVQSLQLLDPALEYLPGGQSASQLARPDWLLYFPALHTAQITRPLWF